MIILPPKGGSSYIYRYIAQIENEDLLSSLQINKESALVFFSNGPEFMDYSYAPGKWTVAQLFRHIVDTERVFAYRALRFVRGDKTVLPGFDQDVFAETVNKKVIDTELLKEEYLALRKSTILLIKSLDAEDLSRTGVMSGYEASALEVFCAISGHERHHINIINERYIR